MARSDLPPSDLGFIEESDGLEYRAVSVLAVLGLFAGVLAVGATFWPLLWVVPPTAILLNGMALARIKRGSPELTGTRLALAGMALAVFFAAMIPTQRLAYGRAIGRESREVAAIWFDSLRDDRPVEACQIVSHSGRRALAQVTQEATVAGSEFRESLERFVAQPEVRCLLALGPKAQVRHYATEARDLTMGKESVVDVYAVTYEEEGRKQSFFVRLALARDVLPGADMSDWTVTSSRGGYRPVALGGGGK